MSTPAKKPYRKRHLFARSVEDVVKSATQSLLNQQGKLYGALLRDWTTIVGAQRAGVCLPLRLQFPTHEQRDGATLHVRAKPSAALELSYEIEPMLEQCARYFGYRAIVRIIIHRDTQWSSEPSKISAAATEVGVATPTPEPTPMNIAADAPASIREALTRLAQRMYTVRDNKP